MTNKASLLLAALLVVPTAAMAQTPPAPPAGAPAPLAPGSMMRHFTFSQADMAAMKAQMDKLQAAHKATRAKILAALTPAHRALLASLVGDLAISANPDPQAATAKLDAALSASEKANILAIHTAAMSQMKTLLPAMMPPAGGPITRFKRVMVIKNADGTTSTTTSDSMTPPGPPGMMLEPGEHMKHMSRSMTAGEILMHLASSGEGSPMMIRMESSGHRGGWAPHPPMQPVPPVAPAPTPSP